MIDCPAQQTITDIFDLAYARPPDGGETNALYIIRPTWTAGATSTRLRAHDRISREVTAIHVGGLLDIRGDREIKAGQ